MNARAEERQQFGETVYLLHPNIKRSRGGLRDIQLIRWVGFVRYGETDPMFLERMGTLLPNERRKLREAYEFLLRLRNELHFQFGKAQDLLDRSEQVRLAELLEIQGPEGVLPVEQFMRQYYEYTESVRNIASNFLANARSRSPVSKFLGALFSRNVGRDFQIGPRHIRATRLGQEKLRADLGEVLRLMDLANLCDKWIDHTTWQTIRAAQLGPAELPVTTEATRRFLSLMSQPMRLADLLRRLHQLQVLERLVPPMAHARCLLQFNEYHKYTIDEHCIRGSKSHRDVAPTGRAGPGLSRITRKKDPAFSTAVA